MPLIHRLRRAAARGFFAAVASGGIFAAVIVASGAAAAGPREVITEFHEAIARTLGVEGRLSQAERYDGLRRALDGAFDLRHMAQSASAPAWESADAASRDALVDAFARISAMTYAEQLSGFDKLSFAIDGISEDLDGTRRVAARIASADSTLPLTYVMIRDAGTGDWRVADVLLFNAISEIAVRKSEYRAFLKRGGMQKLVAALNDRADEMAGP